MQCADRLGGIFSQRVANRDDSKDTAGAVVMWPMSNDHNGLASTFDVGKPAFNILGANAQFVREAVIAYKISMTVDKALCAASQRKVVAKRAAIIGWCSPGVIE